MTQFHGSVTLNKVKNPFGNTLAIELVRSGTHFSLDTKSPVCYIISMIGETTNALDADRDTETL
jgi:hypothetical protein